MSSGSSLEQRRPHTAAAKQPRSDGRAASHRRERRREQVQQRLVRRRQHAVVGAAPRVPRIRGAPHAAARRRRAPRLPDRHAGYERTTRRNARRNRRRRRSPSTRRRRTSSAASPARSRARGSSRAPAAAARTARGRPELRQRHRAGVDDDRGDGGSGRNGRFWPPERTQRTAPTHRGAVRQRAARGDRPTPSERRILSFPTLGWSRPAIPTLGTSGV